MAKPNNNPDDNKPSGLASISIASVGALKVILGASCIIAPQLAGRLFLLDIPPQAVIMARLFGSSCAGLGAVTWNLNRRVVSGVTNKEDLRLVVIANILADSVDVLSCTTAFTTGIVGNGAFGLLGGGCVVLAALGLVGFGGL